MTLPPDILLVAVETVECALEVDVVASHDVVSLVHNVVYSEAGQMRVERMVLGQMLAVPGISRVGGKGRRHL